MLNKAPVSNSENNLPKVTRCNVKIFNTNIRGKDVYFLSSIDSFELSRMFIKKIDANILSIDLKIQINKI